MRKDRTGTSRGFNGPPFSDPFRSPRSLATRSPPRTRAAGIFALVVRVDHPSSSLSPCFMKGLEEALAELQPKAELWPSSFFSRLTGGRHEGKAFRCRILGPGIRHPVLCSRHSAR